MNHYRWKVLLGFVIVTIIIAAAVTIRDWAAEKEAERIVEEKRLAAIAATVEICDTWSAELSRGADGSYNQDLATNIPENIGGVVFYPGPRDWWGNNILASYKEKSTVLVIISKGADGKIGTDDDISRVEVAPTSLKKMVIPFIRNSIKSMIKKRLSKDDSP